MTFFTSLSVVALVASALALFAVARSRPRLLRWMAAVLCATGLASLSLGMSGIRAHIVQARERGVSEDHVQGMIERQRLLTVPRVSAAISLVGLTAALLLAGRKPH